MEREREREIARALVICQLSCVTVVIGAVVGARALRLSSGSVDWSVEGSWNE